MTVAVYGLAALSLARFLTSFAQEHGRAGPALIVWHDTQTSKNNPRCQRAGS